MIKYGMVRLSEERVVRIEIDENSTISINTVKKFVQRNKDKISRWYKTGRWEK